MIADVSALFVRPDGPYPQLVADWWDEKRNAFNYTGPNPVVLHPPCARWCRYWYTDGSRRPGEDGGLFKAALGLLGRHGGVLEHPEGSLAWPTFDLPRPMRGKWTQGRRVKPGFEQGIYNPRGVERTLWSAVVDQSTYGHPARKCTWLLYVGHREPPPIDWRHTRGQRQCQSLSHRQRALTPEPFARLLIDLARFSRETGE